MEKFGFSGLWKSIGSTVIALSLSLGDALLTYFGKIDLPQWAHVVVAIATAAFALYKGKVEPKPQLVPPPAP